MTLREGPKVLLAACILLLFSLSQGESVFTELQQLDEFLTLSGDCERQFVSSVSSSNSSSAGSKELLRCRVGTLLSLRPSSSKQSTVLTVDSVWQQQDASSGGQLLLGPDPYVTVAQGEARYTALRAARHFSRFVLQQRCENFPHVSVIEFSDFSLCSRLAASQAHGSSLRASRCGTHH